MKLLSRLRLLTIALLVSVIIVNWNKTRHFTILDWVVGPGAFVTFALMVEWALRRNAE